MSKVFDETALARFRKRQASSKSLSLITPPLRNTLILTGILSIGGIIWTVFAKVPIKVKAIGMITPVADTSRMISLETGTVNYYFTQNHPDDHWSSLSWKLENDYLSMTKDNIESLSQQILKPSLRNSVDNNVITSTINKPGFTSQKFSRGHLLAKITSNSERSKVADAYNKYLVEKKIVNEARASLDYQDSLLTGQLNSQRGILNDMDSLASKGWVSRQTILENTAKVDDLKSRIVTNQNDFNTKNAKLTNAYGELVASLHTYIGQTMLFAEQDLYISLLLVSQSSPIKAGEEVLLLSFTQPKLPTLIPIFMENKDATQVYPGMNALATPEGIARSQYGGIKGKVLSKQPVTLSRQELLTITNLEGLTDLITQKIKTPTTGVLKLDRNQNNTDNRSGYEWSSNGNPPFPVDIGDVVNVDITTRYETPISLVIPWFKRTLGISPPKDQRSNRSQNQRGN